MDRPRRAATKVVGWEVLLEARDRARAEGRVVAWTNGCFDLLHVGHVRSFEAARAEGDLLVVGLNSDASIRLLKGAGRPIVPEAARAELVAALACVDYVIVFDEATPERAIDRLRPDVHCKGADYRPPGGRAIPEARLVESYGGRVAFLPFVAGSSTTELIDQIRADAPASTKGRHES
jgi:rfaE bifunctional protein nucleotidyltransferase chain/domain